MSGKYDDIINMPHHVSTRHRPMSRGDRAAQFSPFSALTGYEAALSESARVTDERIELDEQEQQRLDEKLNRLRGCANERPVVSITHFVPDGRKQGGAYVTTEQVCVRRVDAYARAVCLTGGGSIAFRDIIGIEGDIFQEKS